MIKELKKDQIIKCSDKFDLACYTFYKILKDFNIYEEALSFSDNPFNLDLIKFMQYLESKEFLFKMKNIEIVTTDRTCLELLE